MSHELIRVAILWHEMWHEALEEASRLYFGESNVDGMLNTLLPLHEMMDKQGPSTLKEIAFVQAYGRELQAREKIPPTPSPSAAFTAPAAPDSIAPEPLVSPLFSSLQEAYEWCLKYKNSRKEAELHQVLPPIPSFLLRE